MRTSQLPYLVKLLDDPSPEVRSEVVRAMEAFGSSLDGELEKQSIRLSRSEAEPIQHILDKGRRREFKSSWHSWLSIKADKPRLEAALQIIVALQDGNLAARGLARLLDELAERYLAQTEGPNAIGLSRFLFGDNGIHGVEQNDYLNPLNSNLLYVITERKGLPISLSCVLLLVGHRLGIHIEGCNVPGHFLAIARLDQGRVLVDCYNKGRLIDETDLAGIDSRISMKDLLRLECRADDIIARVLRNLVNAYNTAGNAPNAKAVAEALSTMDTESRQPTHRDR